jgi:hypothetical protein
MATALPLIVIDEVMLPGPGTELGLEPAEVAFLRADFRAGVDLFVPVAIGCRREVARGKTRLERREGPGELCPAVLIGEATILEPSEGDPAARLQVAETRRARLERWETKGQGLVAYTVPWPLTSDPEVEGRVDGLCLRFFRMLLATRSTSEGIRPQIEEPVGEITQAPSPALRLMLLADYLFEQPTARLAALEAEGVGELADQVGDALEILESGAQGSSSAVLAALGEWLRAAQREGVGGLARVAEVLVALAPLVDPGEASLKRLMAMAGELKDLEKRFDLWVRKALKPGRGKP